MNCCCALFSIPILILLLQFVFPYYHHHHHPREVNCLDLVLSLGHMFQFFFFLSFLIRITLLISILNEFSLSLSALPIHSFPHCPLSLCILTTAAPPVVYFCVDSSQIRQNPTINSSGEDSIFSSFFCCDCGCDCFFILIFIILIVFIIHINYYKTSRCLFISSSFFPLFPL